MTASKPYGLVLAGGGAKGAYQIGAWRALREMNIEFSSVAGVSIGAINGALIAAGKYDTALTLWNNVTVEKGVNIAEDLPEPNSLFSAKNFSVLLREFVKNGGIDASPTKTLLEQYISEQDVRQSGIGFGLVTIQLSGGMSPLELTLKDIPEGELIDYLLASAHVPGVTKIGPDGERFLDGGVYDNAPVGFMRRHGFNRLIIIDISSLKGYAHNMDITNCEAVYIRPYEIDELGASFDFGTELIEKRMTIGYLDTRKAFSELLGNIFYFEPQEFLSLIDEYGAALCLELEQLAWSLKLRHDTVYTAQRFLRDTKILYDEKKAEAAAKAEEENKFYSQIKKVVSNFMKDDGEKNAIAILDNIIL